MEHLTFDCDYCFNFCHGSDYQEEEKECPSFEHCLYRKFFYKLKEYEETELEPKEIDAIIRLNDELVEENAELKKRLEKSVELPYKSGDTVYAIDKYKHYLKPCLIKHVIVDCYDIIFVTDSLTVNDELYEYNFYYYDIGKYVFLTKEEAEQKLKEMKK